MKNILPTILLLSISVLAYSEVKNNLDSGVKNMKVESGNYDVSSIEKINNDIENQGAKSVTRLVFSHPGTRFKFLDYIEQGNERYFELGIKLHNYTDAAWSTDLRMAYARSWLSNPRYVLPLISNKNSLLAPDNMCSLPFWSDAETVQEKINLEIEIVKYLKKAILILESEERSRNESFAEYCFPVLLDKLEESQTELEHLTKPSNGASR